MSLPRGVENFKEMLEDIEFRDFLDSYFEHISGAYTPESWADMVIGVYELKSWLHPVLVRYIETGGEEIDSSLVAEPVDIESEEYAGTVKLVLAPDITRPELEDFIARNWSKKIRPKLFTSSNGRYIVPKNTRNNSIYRDYLSGKSVAYLSYNYGIPESTIYRIISIKKKMS